MTERIAHAVTGFSPNHARDIDRGGGAVLAAPLRNWGVRPRTELAECCELSTAASILVDHRLRAHHEPTSSRSPTAPRSAAPLRTALPAGAPAARSGW